jgi:hypothetical protein
MRAADPALLEGYLALENRLPRALEEYEEMLDELTEALAAALDDVSSETALEPPGPNDAEQ